MPTTHVLAAGCAILLSATATQAQTLFQSNLDTDTGWTVLQEAAPSSLATFGFNYSTVGIPASPNGGGTTLGLRLAANANSTIQAITAATTASFSGQYRVTFDFWGNTNGPLPAGGTGSTEHLGGGVGFSGTVPRKGASLLTSIEGGVGATTPGDWRLDKDAALQPLSSGFYDPAITSLDITSATSGNPSFYFTTPFPGQSAPASQGTGGTALNGTVAFGWHKMTIVADSVAGTADFTVDSTHIGTLTQATGALSIAGSGSLTLLDAFTSVSSTDLAADQVFAVFDNYSVVAVPEPTAASLLSLAGLVILQRGRRRIR